MSTRVPVYCQHPHGVIFIKGVGTIKGKMIQGEPSWVPSFLFKQFRYNLIIAPMTKAYLEELFGNHYFTDSVFELEHLHHFTHDFLNRLAKKVGVSVKRTYTRKGKARKIAARIREKMGIA